MGIHKVAQNTFSCLSILGLKLKIWSNKIQMWLFSRCIWSLLEDSILSNAVQQAVQVQEAGQCGARSSDEATTCNSSHSCDGGGLAEPPLANSHRSPLLWGPWSSLLIISLGPQWVFVSITTSTVNICHNFEPNDFCTNTSSFKVLVGEGRRPRIEEREHQGKVIQVKKKNKQTKSKKPSTSTSSLFIHGKGRNYLSSSPIYDLFFAVFWDQ